jgi:hypothetical protein
MGLVSWVFSSAFANAVVIGLMGASLVLAFGTLYLAINQRAAKTMLVNGLILAGVVLSLSAFQFQCVPVSFHGVARLGLASLPSGPVTSVFDTIIGYCFTAISLIGALCIPLGLVMLVARIDWGPKCLIMGGIMTILGSVISNGGIFSVVLAVLGLHVPVVA